MLRERRQRVKRKVPADCPLVCQNRDEPWPPTGPPDGSKSATDGPVQMQIECTPSWSIAANDRLGLNFLVLGRAGKVRYRREAVAEAGFAQGQLSAVSSRSPDPRWSRRSHLTDPWPKISLSLRMSPVWMPMRHSMRSASGTPAFRSAMPAWISLAQRSAATVLADSAKRPSLVS